MVGFRPVRIFIVVVFPAPFTPNSPKSSPFLISKFKLSTAVKFLYFFVKSLVTIEFTYFSPQ